MSMNDNGKLESLKSRDYQTDTLYTPSQVRTIAESLQRTPTSRLGSAQRSEQMDRTVAQVEALTERVNQQTQAINNLSYALKAEQQARELDGQLFANRLLMFTRMSLWKRLRWLVGL